MVKKLSAHGECLGSERRRKTWQPAKSPGELATSLDPGMSEWGNPAGEILSSRSEYIGPEKRTRGTETSQYPQEKKSTEISRVAASEREGACTWKAVAIKPSGLERPAIEGESPVGERWRLCKRAKSRTGHEKSCLKKERKLRGGTILQG